MAGLDLRARRLTRTDPWSNRRDSTVITRRSSSKIELLAIILFLVNNTHISRLDLRSWVKSYHRDVIKQAIKSLTAIPCCLYESSDRTRESMVLVTGGLGYVGSHVCLELLRRGYTVLIIDDLTNSFGDTVRDTGLALEASPGRGYSKTSLKRIFHILIDYGDIGAVDQALRAYTRHFQILGAVHLAASKSVAENFKSPWKYYDNNVVKMERFLRVLGSYGVGNVVFSSSATVYGCLPPEITSNTALKEDMVPLLDPGVPRDEILSMAANPTRTVSQKSWMRRWWRSLWLNIRNEKQWSLDFLTPLDVILPVT